MLALGSIATFTFSIGGHSGIAGHLNQQALSDFRDMFRDRIKDWKTTEEGLEKRTIELLIEQRDMLMDRLVGPDGYFVPTDEHTLAWMAGRDPGKTGSNRPKRELSEKARRYMFHIMEERARDNGDMTHPYARSDPWFEGLGHPAGSFHIQNSGRSGVTGGGTSLFANLIKVDDYTSISFAIAFSNIENLYYWRYLQMGTKKMVARGSLKQRLGRRYRDQFHAEFVKKIKTYLQGRARRRK